MNNENRKGLVRGVVEVKQKGFEPIKAFTLWHRQDEPDLLSVIDRETKPLIEYYMGQYSKCDSVTVSRDWRYPILDA